MSTERILGGIQQNEGSENSLEIETLAKFAVDEHNKKENALLEFHRVVNTKEQVVAGIMYYITLEATDGDKKKVYEARVWVKPWLNFKQVQGFQYVGDADSPASRGFQQLGCLGSLMNVLCCFWCCFWKNYDC